MSSIIKNGDTYHGISVESRGVFTNDKYGGRTYAGQCRDGYACGLGVLTGWFEGHKTYAEHGPDGQFDGRRFDRYARNTWYTLFERGKPKDSARVFADGRCTYNGLFCAPDDPRVLALIAQVAPVEVHPAAPAIRPPSPPTHPQTIVRWISRLVLPQ